MNNRQDWAQTALLAAEGKETQQRVSFNGWEELRTGLLKKWETIWMQSCACRSYWLSRNKGHCRIKVCDWKRGRCVCLIFASSSVDCLASDNLAVGNGVGSMRPGTWENCAIWWLFLFCKLNYLHGYYLHMCRRVCVTSWSPKWKWKGNSVGERKEILLGQCSGRWNRNLL